MLEGVVFREGLPNEFESKAETRKYRAKSDEFGLRAASFTPLVAGSSKEAGHARSVWEVDVGAVDGQKAKGVFPKHGRGEFGLEATDQLFPKVPPEPESELFSSLAESLFGDAAAFELWADGSHQSPRSAKPLGHRSGLQADVHHQPRNDFRNERAFPLGGAVTPACRCREDFRREDFAKRCQAESLENS